MYHYFLIYVYVIILIPYARLIERGAHEKYAGWWTYDMQPS